MVEPYKSELLPHWKFKNPPTATASSSKLYRIFLTYLSEDDFVGADLTNAQIHPDGLHTCASLCESQRW